MAWLLRGPFVVRTPRIATVAGDPARLEAIVRYLAVDCVPRSHLNPANLERAADFIEKRFRDSGDSPHSLVYTLREGTFRNVIVRREGSEPELGMVVIGAHYDAYMHTPGADDNASGVAVLLELARLTAGQPHERTHLFVAFATEEPPFFGTADMGSAHLARSLVEGGEAVHLMVALDMVGHFCDEPGCQPYPFAGMGLVYPSRGNYLAVTGHLGAGAWIREAKRGIAAAHSIPVVSFRSPRAFGYTDLSDHSSFWDAGLPGVLVTDTAMLRNPRYHRPADTPDTLDYARMGQVIQGLQALLTLADAS